MNALEIKNLRKAYPGFQLDDLNLTLPQGCILGLIGENGAGKSTTIKLILDLIQADSGSITLLGRDHRENIRLSREDIGVVLDEVGIPECLTASQVSKVMNNTFQSWDSARFAALLKELSLPENKPFKELSRGMKMKLGIAIALSHGAKLLILDEATSGLDPVVRDELLDIFNDFTRDEGNSVLISSHIVSDLEKICDYIAFLHRGRLMLCREKDELLNEYAFVQGSREEIDKLNPIGRRDGRFGTEAIVRRSEVPEGMKTSPITIEDLFIFMAKEEGR